MVEVAGRRGRTRSATGSGGRTTRSPASTGGWPTNGLLAGHRVRLPPRPAAGRSAGSSRAGPGGSAPSRTGRRRRLRHPFRCRAVPSGPNWSWPPLWFDWVECGMVRTDRRVLGSAMFGSLASRLNSSTWIFAGTDGARVVDVEEAARRVVRRKCNREQPALVAVVRDEQVDVQERRRLDDAVQDELDLSGLLNDDKATRVTRRRGDVRGGRECPDRVQQERARGGRGATVLPEQRQSRQSDGERQ